MEDAAGGDRVSVTYTASASHLVKADAANALLILAGGSVTRTVKYLARKRRESGYSVTVTADDYGLTYTTPAKSTALPWSVWHKADRRFGIWIIRLAAQPTVAITIPTNVLDQDQTVLLTRMLAGHGLLRNSKG